LESLKDKKDKGNDHKKHGEHKEEHKEHSKGEEEYRSYESGSKEDNAGHKKIYGEQFRKSFPFLLA
jgi:hypothetical protein